MVTVGGWEEHSMWLFAFDFKPVCDFMRFGFLLPLVVGELGYICMCVRCVLIFLSDDFWWCSFFVAFLQL